MIAEYLGDRMALAHEQKALELGSRNRQPWLPPSPREWLAEDHQVYSLLELVDELDLSAILIPAQAKDPRDEKGFDPRM